jgi:hypothetical protein
MAGLATLFVEQMANLIPDLTEFVDELMQAVIDQGVEQLVEQLAMQLMELRAEQSVV